MVERARRRRGVLAAWAAVWLLVAATGVVAHMVTETELSPIDEYQHVDYLDKTIHLHVVNGGEKVDQSTMREVACRGTALPGYKPPPCRSKTFDPDAFPGLGYNHTYADPPTYYAITGPVAEAAKAITGVSSIVTAARGVGILWLAGGLFGTFLLARRLGADEWAAAGATLMLASTPVLLEATSTVTTDAPELLIGAVLTLLGVGVVERRVSPWWLALGALVAGAFKTTSLSAIGVVGLFLLINLVRARRAQRVAAVRPAPEEGAHRAAPAPVAATERGSASPLPLVLLLVCGGLPILAWSVIAKALAYSSVDQIPVATMFKVDSITWKALGGSFPYLFTPVNDPYLPAFMKTPSIALCTLAVNVLLIVGCFSLAWYGRRDQLASSLAASAATCMVLGGPAFVLLIYFSQHVSYAIQGRYGLALLPAAAACLAVAASEKRYGGALLVVLGVLGMAAFIAACA